MKFNEDGPFDWASESHLEICEKLYLLETS